MSEVRRLVVVLGDQLDPGSAAFDGFDRRHDRVWMAEVAGEAEQVWSHRSRIAIFLAAMRHFREELGARGLRVEYSELADSTETGAAAAATAPETTSKTARRARRTPMPVDGPEPPADSLGTALARAVRQLRPREVVVVEPGEWRIREQLLRAVPELEIRTDRHFLCSPEEFAAHARGRKQLRMEFFYRELRRKTATLMEDGRPAGGVWNFDAANRAAFGRDGPGQVRPPRSFPPDPLTREVLALVRRRFASHPGSLERFDWPVTRAQARQALRDFLRHRLPHFGLYQDAMWAGEPYLYHSRLSAALNLKLLDPREAIDGAEEAWRAGAAPIEAAEGFIRQVLGWREYVRGIYELRMPEYLEANALGAGQPLPGFYWTGETEMRCLREAIGQTLTLGYAHHIQRLMVTGLYALLLGVDPVEVHRWYLAVYVDAVEWVELPNVLGMSQYADGGIMASKPYVATGRYIQRMSDYCRGCRFDPSAAAGESACPFTTLYWDFLSRHEAMLRRNPRTRMQVHNLERLDGASRVEIRRRAERLKARP